MKALIDGDIIVYSVGFAANDDPLANALHSVKVLIQSIIDAIDADWYEIYLTGKGNYRDDVATIKPYKGNRAESAKPFHYDAIRKYLIDKHEAIVCEGYEADDAMAMEQYANKDSMSTCICSLDKDLQMIEGLHYNWRKGETTVVTEIGALKNFWIQMLTGDTVDNIAGCYGIGKKKAEKILSEYNSWNDMKCIVGYHYATCLYKGNEYTDPEKAMLENARLLWMSRNSIDDYEAWDNEESNRANSS